MIKGIKDFSKNGKNSSVYSAPFDEVISKAVRDLDRAVSLEYNSLIRRLAGKESSVSQNGNYTAECWIYDPQTGIYLSKWPLIRAYPEQATQDHREGKEFYISEQQIKRATSKIYARQVEDKRVILIPSDYLQECEVTSFSFGKQAKETGKFLLNDCGIEAIPIFTVDPNHLPIGSGEKDEVNRGKPFARQNWFYGLGNNGRFALGGNDRCLHYGNAVRTIPKSDEEFYEST